MPRTTTESPSAQTHSTVSPLQEFSSAATARPPAPSGTTAILRLIGLVLRNATLIVGSVLVFGALMFVYGWTRPRTFTSSAGFVLQAPKQISAALPGLAAQFGIGLPASEPSHSPAFYAEMIKSRSILAALADSTFTYRDGGSQISTSLADAYKVGRRAPSLRREATIERLDNAVFVRTSAKSGVVTFSIKAPAPDLAQNMAASLLRELTFFNQQRRQSQAAAERRFTEQRLAEISVQLRAAEEELESFLRRNRSGVDNSPQLRFEEQRLDRALELRRTLYTTMAQSYEQARIDEVRDTPQITIVQAPEIAALADSRLLVGKTLAAAMLGALLALLIAFSRERLNDARMSSSREVAELEGMRAAMVDTLQRTFRLRRRD